MKILHLIYDDVENPWIGGGGAYRTREIYQRLSRWGHDCTVLCGNYPGAKDWQAGPGQSQEWPEGCFQPFPESVVHASGSFSVSSRGVGVDLAIALLHPSMAPNADWPIRVERIHYRDLSQRAW